MRQAATSGDEAWGRWSHTSSDISIELLLDECTNAQKVAVEVTEGWLFAGNGLGNEPLLYGRLAQPVRADELTW